MKQYWVNDENVQDIISRLSSEEIVPKYSYFKGLLYRNERSVVGRNTELHTQIIQFFHASALGGHFGVTALRRE